MHGGVGGWVRQDLESPAQPRRLVVEFVAAVAYNKLENQYFLRGPFKRPRFGSVF